MKKLQYQKLHKAPYHFYQMIGTYNKMMTDALWEEVNNKTTMWWSDLISIENKILRDEVKKII
jgi:hypothetical protein